MKTGAKQSPTQSDVAKFRVPASLEEAYELGWLYQHETFPEPGGFWQSKEKITKRVGYACFVTEQGDEIEIPFVATFKFGTPRPVQQPEIDPEEKAESERVSLWKVEHVYKGEVIATFETNGTQQLALEEAGDAFNDELEFRFSEITDQPLVGESTAPTDKK